MDSFTSDENLGALEPTGSETRKRNRKHEGEKIDFFFFFLMALKRKNWIVKFITEKLDGKNESILR